MNYSLQTEATGKSVSTAPPIVHDVLRSPGQRLDAETRAVMEQRFGHDFSRVRIHTDRRAAESAQAVDALAYTVGSDVVFGTNRYAPGLPVGRRLLVHELAHVVQQEGMARSAPDALAIGDPLHGAERAADRAVIAATIPAGHQQGSMALELRRQLRGSRLAEPVIQRAVKTWGGEYDPDTYKLLNEKGVDGLTMVLRFRPNKYVNATRIGMVQTARSQQKGGPVPSGAFHTKKTEKETFESLRIPAGSASAGTMIDQYVSQGNPLYATDKPGAKDVLSTTKTLPGFGQHGWRYRDKANILHKRDALLKDSPRLPSSRKETSQVFESTALALSGQQEGTFYGSVQWGWRKDAAGKVTKLPLLLVSKDVPSSVFAQASELWNKAKTSEGKETIDLPIITAKYTNSGGVWLVRNPSKYEETKDAKLRKNTRVEVINKGEKKAFNRTAERYKWWQVTVVSGTHVGTVGWVMQTNLSDAKSE